MSKPLKPRRGTTAEHAAFIGQAHEVTYDTDKQTLVCHDGLTAGGFPLARADEVAQKDAEQDAAIAEAKSSADEKALSFEVDGLDLVVTYGNGSTERVKLPTGKGVGDLWWGHDQKSVPANVQLYSGQLLSRSAYEAHSALVLGGKRTVVSESEWQSYASAHGGMCPYYSSGDGSTTYRMPCIKGVHPKFVAALAEAGQYVAAGLPHINASWPSAPGLNNSGAFSGAVQFGEMLNTFAGTGKGYGVHRYIFDASLSNTIYGASTTVQPPALTFLLGEYVVGSVAVVGEADAESLLASVTQLEVGKAETDLSNLSTAGRSLAAGLGMPSGRYVDLTLGATDTMYTAPGNGYFSIVKRATAANQFLNMYNRTSGNLGLSQTISTSGVIASFLPARKGDSVFITYNANGTLERFRFIYAEGEDA